jgi:hypothetical protein
VYLQGDYYLVSPCPLQVFRRQDKAVRLLSVSNSSSDTFWQ